MNRLIFRCGLYLVSFFLISNLICFAGELDKVVVLQEIQKSIQRDYNLSDSIKIIEKEVIEEKQITKGETTVQKLLRKNREKIKQLQKEKKEEANMKKGDWIQNRKSQNNKWYKKKSQGIANWQKKKKRLINKWIKERKRFIKRIPQYKKNLTALPVKVFKKKIVTRKSVKVTVPLFQDYHLVKGAMDVAVKDQGRRPTCSAFSAVRALEIMMAQENNYAPLSEQYFYWASKPQCQRTPCTIRGSWVIIAFTKSKRSSMPDIPLEKNCPYTKKSKNNNETQTPLRNTCHIGKVKVRDYRLIDDLNGVVDSLNNNYPVVAGFKLSESFYKNDGYVFLSSKTANNGSLDSHSQGHAILLVGHMKLPKELHRDEGKFCLLVANSWGVGWGKGGHACISQKWFEKYNYGNSSVSLRKIEIL